MPSRKYAGEFLGTSLHARTLPEFFADVINLASAVAPEALVELSTWRTSARRFVAAEPEAVHPRNPHLPVLKTASGWWISRNIGQEDLERALSALCSVSRLTYGRDVMFTARP